MAGYGFSVKQSVSQIRQNFIHCAVIGDLTPAF